ncbi:MAG TPA: type VII secretion protein EccE [Pseudonocardiaceae bacterium]|jgi:type VII secretion protein EccE|nr:type VII secretion protein EccE [Pseudonocardiaceae bacterium]
MTSTVRPAPVPQAKGARRSGPAGDRIGLLRPVRAGQAVLWELMVLAVVATAFPWRTLSIAVAAVAVVVVAVTSVRWSGLCAYQWVAVHLRFRRRPATSKGTDPLGVLAPGVRSRRQIDRAGNRAGLIEDGDSLVAVVRLTPTANPDAARLLDVLESTVRRTDIPLACAQLVVWSVPSPPRAQYYGGRRDTDPVQVHWLVVRYRPADAPAATVARGGGETGAARATATAALTLAGTLVEAGFGGVVLDESELRQELLVALGTDSAALAGTAECTVQETWRDWSIGTLRQITYRPRAAADGRTVLGRFVPQAAFTCTSYSLRRTARGALRGESVVRVGTHPTGRTLQQRQVGQALGVDLLPGNGRHAESVVDNLPLAR